MSSVQNQTDSCGTSVVALTNLVNELQSKENRNDEFMRDLLTKTEHLENFKVNNEEYIEGQDNIWQKFKVTDKYNKENHVHYVQIENYLDKYLPLK